MRFFGNKTASRLRFRHTGLQRCGVGSAMDAEQTTNARQHEPKTERDGTEALGRDNEQQRIALRAIRQFGIQQAQGLHRDHVVDFQVRHTGILPGGGIEIQKAAAFDHGAVNGNTNAGGWPKTKSEIRKPQIFLWCGEIQQHAEANAIDAGLEWPEIDINSRSGLQRQRLAVRLRHRLQGQGERLQARSAQRFGNRNEEA